MSAVTELRSLFWGYGFDVPKAVRVSVGFPSSLSKIAEGEVWDRTCSADDTWEIFISPLVGNPICVLGILVHELVHMVVGTEHGHKAPFKRCALAVGLTGVMTESVPGEGLLATLGVISAVLGIYPHAELSFPVGVEKQTTRLLKLQCLDCTMPLRITRKWLDAYPTPWACPCGGELVSEEDA